MNNEQKPATLDDVVAVLQKNQETLEEIKVWAKINGVEKVQDILKKTLNSPEKITIYHLSMDEAFVMLLLYVEVLLQLLVIIGVLGTCWV